MNDLSSQLPLAWRTILRSDLGQPYAVELATFLADERASHQVFPPAAEVFRALELTPPDKVRVVILGQDPYHDDGQAHGLAFSVRMGVKPPPSLVNMFKELETDLAIPRPRTGCLEPWARQGMLLLNAVLTVRAHAAGSHQKQGWETFTDAIIRAVAERREPAIFVLWGAHAQKKAKLIAAGSHRHVIIQSAHPSPLSARNGFFGSRPFSRIDAALAEMGHPAIDWGLDT